MLHLRLLGTPPLHLLIPPLLEYFKFYCRTEGVCGDISVIVLGCPNQPKIQHKHLS